MHSNCILDSVANLLVRHMVFVGNVQKSSIASHLCLGMHLYGIRVEFRLFINQGHSLPK